jgi:MFS family permease
MIKNLQYYKFSFYGFFKNLRFFESFLLLFFLEKGVSWVEIGFLYSIREITIVVTEIPSGVIADAMGRRRTLLLAFFVYILSFLTFYFSNSYLLIAFAMLLFAFADAFRSGVHKAMIIHYLKVNGLSSKKTEYYGHTRSWSQRGSAVSSLIAASIVFYSGNYQMVFLASVIPYLLDMLLVWSYPKWLDGEMKKIDTISVKQKFVQVGQGLVQSFKNPFFLKALVSSSLYTGYYKAVKDYVQPVIKMLALSVPAFAWWNDDKKTAVFIGVFYFVIYLLTSWMSRNSGRFQNLFVNYYKPMNFTLLAGITAGAVSGMIYAFSWYGIAVAGFVIVLLIENLRKPIGVSVIADLSQHHAMASVLSLSSQVKSLFAALLAPMIGWVAEKYSPGAGIAAVSLLLLLFYPFYRLANKKPAR